MRADLLSKSPIPCPASLRQAHRADMSRAGFIGLVAAWTVMLGVVLAISVCIRLTV